MVGTLAGRAVRLLTRTDAPNRRGLSIYVGEQPPLPRRPAVPSVTDLRSADCPNFDKSPTLISRE